MADGALSYEELARQNSELRREVTFLENQKDDLLVLLCSIEHVVLEGAHGALIRHMDDFLRKHRIKQPYEGRHWGPIKKEGE